MSLLKNATDNCSYAVIYGMSGKFADGSTVNLAVASNIHARGWNPIGTVNHGKVKKVDGTPFEIEYGTPYSEIAWTCGNSPPPVFIYGIISHPRTMNTSRKSTAKLTMRMCKPRVSQRCFVSAIFSKICFASSGSSG